MAERRASLTVVAPSAEARLAHAREWLLAHPAGTEVLVVGASLDAAHELLLETVREVPGAATFGWRRTSFGLLARDLAEARLVEARKVAVTRVGAEATVARVVAELSRRGALGRYAPVADTPGFIRALAGCLEELRLAGLSADDVRPVAPELATILDAHAARLEEAALADRADVLLAAAVTASDPSARHRLLDLPTLFLDVPVHAEAERRLVTAVLDRAPDALVTVPAGDDRTLAQLRRPGDGVMEQGEGARHDAVEGTGEADAAGGAGTSGGPGTSLARLQAHLFRRAAPPESGKDETLTIFSAPGENRECVEITRKVLVRAAEGVPFDRMAVLLRAPGDYRAHLEEALARAGIPVHFDRGVTRPDPAGRAFLALLRCREEGYSARRFAEYLSLGEVPDATAEGAPPEAPSSGDRWRPAEDEGRHSHLAPAEGVEGVEGSGTQGAGTDGGGTEGAGTDGGGTLRAPRRWERLIVEASVVGGIDRWRRRLAGMGEAFQLELEALERELDGDERAGGGNGGGGNGGGGGSGRGTVPEAAAEGLRRRIEELDRLRDYALPLLEELAGLPEEGPWETWLDRLSALASRSLRRPDRVLALLTELAPLGPVGPVDLPEVIRVLSARLLELNRPSPGPRYGKLFVGPTEAARGRSFQAVFVPGLADRLFPQKVSEEPVLLDGHRRAIEAGAAGSPGPRLETSEDRVAAEQLALRLAVGAARDQLILSYPRLDIGQSRPRVPSFYALETLRSAEGRLPLFDELAERADAVTEARVGWPAPRRREEAIDEAEYDLAVLEKLHPREGEDAAGHAHYLLTANPHLGRALRGRAYRWEVRKWSAADGLVDAPKAALEALRRYRPDARPVSATALHNFAICPYKFFLSAVHRLEPREAPEAIDRLDPLQKGSLIHDIQFACLSDLRERGLLPVRPATLAEGQEVLDGAVVRVAAEYRERLVPAIERVWEDGIEAIRADLRRWLRETAEDASGFVPWRFELAFGLPRRARQDPDSRAEPVELEVDAPRGDVRADAGTDGAADGAGDGGADADRDGRGGGGRATVAVRGAIDLVERRESDGALRITDHKTGRARVTEGAVLDGGSAVQPVLYALAAEKLFPDRPVVAGRLYYCTSDGGYRTHQVALDERARRAMARAVGIVRGEIERGFLPAAPAERACTWCDYRAVCGPYEERRTARKERGMLRPLLELREMP